MMALAVRALTHRYGRTLALDRVDFSLETGRFAVLLGPNGAGKTTLFNLLTGLFAPQSGEIDVLGHAMRRRPRAALAQLGVVFQQRTVDLDLSVRQNLAYHAALHGLTRVQARTRIAEELARAGLAERAEDRLRALSGGQLRRVEIARALLHRPAVLLLDEPTVGLDSASRQSVLAHIRACQREGRTVLLATHLFDEVVAEDEVLVLHRGSLRAQGRADALMREHGCAGVAALFAALTAPGGAAATAA